MQPASTPHPLPTVGEHYAAEAHSSPYPETSPLAAETPAANARSTPASEPTQFLIVGQTYAVWQCLCDGGWRDYEQAFCFRLENELRLRTPEFSAPTNNVMFRYNLTQMWQENTTTSTRRCIRRLYWHQLDSNAFQQRQRDVTQHNRQNADRNRGKTTAASSSSGGCLSGCLPRPVG